MNFNPSMATNASDLESLQTEWKHLYQHLLPTAARAKSLSQPTWPIHNDHCFARIILDTVIGISAPWTTRLKSPAYKHMSAEQLRECIGLGRRILEGRVDLVGLDEGSLKLRGKAGKGKKAGDMSKDEKREGEKTSGERVISKYFTQEVLGKRTRAAEDVVREEMENKEKETNSTTATKKQKLLADFTPTPTTAPKSKEEESLPSLIPKNQNHKPITYSTSPYSPNTPNKYKSTPQAKNTEEEDLSPYLHKIALSNSTPFQKRVLTLICQIPRGEYTTYGLISTHLTSSPRAVGTALRSNPFAPHVPCHRILATGGGIGGFHGSWGKNGAAGLNDDKKRALLRGEGVKFDGKGRVVGRAWNGFK